MNLTALTWLHLSDLHCVLERDRSRWPVVKNAVLDDMGEMAAKIGPPNLILFTGDLTFSGKEEQYKKASDILQEVQEKVGGNPLIVPVPGNHDMVRPEQKKLEINPSAIYFKKYNSEECKERRRALITGQSEALQLIEPLFAEYSVWEKQNRSNWISKYPIVFEQGLLPGDFLLSANLNGFQLGLAGLNSAFLHFANVEEGTLAVEPEQLPGSDLPKWSRSHEASLLLMHHPVNWLHHKRRETFESHIYHPKWFTACLCGHMHKSRSRSEGGSGENIRRWLQAGSLFGLEHYGNSEQDSRPTGYSWGRLSRTRKAGEGLLEIWVREGRKSNDGIITLDRVLEQNPMQWKVCLNVISKEAERPANGAFSTTPIFVSRVQEERLTDESRLGSSRVPQNSQQSKNRPKFQTTSASRDAKPTTPPPASGLYLKKRKLTRIWHLLANQLPIEPGRVLAPAQVRILYAMDGESLSHKLVESIGLDDMQFVEGRSVDDHELDTTLWGFLSSADAVLLIWSLGWRTQQGTEAIALISTWALANSEKPVVALKIDGTPLPDGILWAWNTQVVPGDTTINRRVIPMLLSRAVLRASLWMGQARALWRAGVSLLAIIIILFILLIGFGYVSVDFMKKVTPISDSTTWHSINATAENASKIRKSLYNFGALVGVSQTNFGNHMKNTLMHRNRELQRLTGTKNGISLWAVVDPEPSGTSRCVCEIVPPSNRSTHCFPIRQGAVPMSVVGCSITKRWAVRWHKNGDILKAHDNAGEPVDQAKVADACQYESVKMDNPRKGLLCVSPGAPIDNLAEVDQFGVAVCFTAMNDQETTLIEQPWFRLQLSMDSLDFVALPIEEWVSGLDGINENCRDTQPSPFDEIHLAGDHRIKMSDADSHETP